MKTEHLKALAELYKNCEKDGWDGKAAQAVRKETVDKAAEFLGDLPDGMPEPSLGASKDGEITLEWGWSGKTSLQLLFGQGKGFRYIAKMGVLKKEGSLESSGDFSAIAQSVITKRKR